MTEGNAVARFGDGHEVPITAGDVLIIPHGDPHVISNGRAPRIIDADGTLDRYLPTGVDGPAILAGLIVRYPIVRIADRVAA